jgi:hypothetical protein
MTKLSVRLTLLLACVAALGYAAFLTWSTEEHAGLTDSASRHFDATARAAAVAVTDLRAAQQAYVAAGQGEDFWFARVAAIAKDVDDKISVLKSLATVPGTGTALDEAAGALQDFGQMDKRARDYARNHQLTLASDLVFTDGVDLTKKAGDAIERAVTAELAAHDAAIAALRRTEGLALSAVAVGVMLALLLLFPVPDPRTHSKDDVLAGLAALTAKPIVTAPVTAARLKDAPKPRLPDPDLDSIGVAPAPTAAATPQRRVDLGAMAALCVNLARIQDSRALPGLIERAATILRASGIVLWIADPDGRELTPIVVHGYPQLATSLRTIARDAENVTASAYRTGLLQTMKGDAVSNGALAAPLVTSGGCVGVMAAELKDGGEQEESLLAAATIVASQLAMLVGPPSARAKAEAVG